MQLVKPTANYFFFCLFLLLVSLVSVDSLAQENSPFSRYGLGDIYPQQHIALRGMGGISAAYSNFQIINSANPASYGYIAPFPKDRSLKLPLQVTYDVAFSIDDRTLHSADPVAKYNSTNLLPSYLQLGVPLNDRGTALVFGLRPYTRINYSVEENKLIYYDSLGVTDSVHNLFEGDGGMNQVFVGIGKRWMGKRADVSVGVNGGYEWGTKNISTKVDFPADSLQYYRSNSTDTTHFWGVFLHPGIMANLTLKEGMNAYTKNMERYHLSIGASGTFEQQLNATKTVTRQTFFYNDAGAIIPIDSILKIPDTSGHINVPLSYTAGFMITKTIGNNVFEVNKWSFGVDYTSTKWTNYRYYGLPDQLSDSWFLRAGVEFSPDPLSNRSLFSRGLYRVGYYMGEDYINADGNGYKVHAFTFGYSFNLRRFRSYDRQFTTINTAIEYGKRGSNVNNVTENFFKLSLGLSLSDVWFVKRKYD